MYERPLTVAAAIAWLSGLRPESRAGQLSDLLRKSNDLDWNAELVTELRETGVWPAKEVRA